MKSFWSLNCLFCNFNWLLNEVQMFFCHFFSNFNRNGASHLVILVQKKYSRAPFSFLSILLTIFQSHYNFVSLFITFFPIFPIFFCVIFIFHLNVNQSPFLECFLIPDSLFHSLHVRSFRKLFTDQSTSSTSSVSRRSFTALPKLGLTPSPSRGDV